MKDRLYLICLVGTVALWLSACHEDPKPDYAPAAPLGVMVHAEGTTVTFSWEPVSGASAYTVYRSIDEHSYRFIIMVPATPYMDIGLSPGTYWYKVSASNSNGESTLSDACSIAIVETHDTQPKDDGNTSHTSTVTQLSDNRFNGLFTGTRDYSNIGVHYDLKLAFDGTNKIQWYSQTTDNGIEEAPYEFTYEMEINTAGKFRRRLWSNSYSTWTTWLDYAFGPGDKLTIQWYDFFEPGSYDVYYKTDTYTHLNQNSTERTVLDFSEEEIYVMMKQLEEKHLEEYKDK